MTKKAQSHKTPGIKGKKHIGFFPVNKIWLEKWPQPDTWSDAHAILKEFALDIKIQDVELCITYDGLFLLSLPSPIVLEISNTFQANTKILQDHIAFSNFLTVIFSSSIFETEKQSFPVNYIDFGNYITSFIDKKETSNIKGLTGGSNFSRILSDYFSNRDYSSRTVHDLQFENSPSASLNLALKHYRFVSIKAINRTVEMLKAVLSHNNKNDLITLISRLNFSLSEHNGGQFSSSLINSWFVLELIISRLWEDYLKNDKKILGKRLNKLSGKDYTASHKCEILELNGVITVDELSNLNSARQERNALAHSSKAWGETSIKSSKGVINLALHFIEKRYNIKIYSSLVFNYCM